MSRREESSEMPDNGYGRPRRRLLGRIRTTASSGYYVYLRRVAKPFDAGQLSPPDR
jgi:hypothetical protein